VRVRQIPLLLSIFAVAFGILGPRPGSASATGVAAVAAGGAHTCALITAGGVQCWGYNLYDQLGSGANENVSTTPVEVVGLGSGVTAIAGGGLHTCILTMAGGVQCWGRNDLGQLGDGTTTQRATAVNVVGLPSGVAAVAGGGFHTCALTTGGGVKCWGLNDRGQLGDGTSGVGNMSTTPVDVVGLNSGVAAVAAGLAFTCALTTVGSIKCWGWNSSGQLGDGTITTSATPVDVTGLRSDIAAVAAGRHHVCVVTTAGGAKCWGQNGFGQLGDGTDGNIRTTPVAVVGLGASVAAIAPADLHTCALTAAGRVQCWGHNVEGQLGDGTTTDSSTPVDVTGLTSGVAAITASESSSMGYTCALTAAGGVKCWGHNKFGQLGDGTSTDRAAPVDVVGLGPKATPTPPSVGGTAELPEVAGMPLEVLGSSGRNVGFVAGVTVAVTVSTVTLTGAAWYARRRWVA